ncbi:MAG: PDZ domain-containing protein [candidate division Zixibacteria bacterium]|nr:PDZ domain-containing protein [candidate division Zixibacteria bacterium]
MKKIIVTLSIMGLVLILAVGHALSGSRSSSDRGWLGISMQSVDYDLVEAFELDVKYGAIINDVFDKSPAEKAGLQEDDVIIAFNGEKVTDGEDLTDLLDDTKTGDKVELTIIRDDKTLTLKAELGEQPPRRKLSKRNVFRHNDGVFYSHGTHGYIGVKLIDLTKQLGEHYGVKDGRGALIMDVEGDSPAEEAGLKAGDVIIEVDGDEVFDGDDVSDIIGDMEKGNLAAVKVMRDGKESEFKLTVVETDDQRFDRIFGPDISVVMPHHSGRYLHRSDFDWDEFEFDFDFDDFAHDFEQLEHLQHLDGLGELEDLDDLLEELGRMKIDLKHDVRGATKDVHRFRMDEDELRDDMRELREELKKMNEELRRDLRDIRDRLD